MSDKKIFIAGAMAVVFSISGQFVQFDKFGSQNFFGTKTAEAFNLGGIGKLVLDHVLKYDVKEMQKRHDSMINNLSKAAICYAQASIDVSDALGLDPGHRAQMEAALTNLKNNKTDLGAIKMVSETTAFDNKKISEVAQKMMSEEDKEKIEKVNELMKKSKTERKAANMYKVLAAKDAALIIASSVKAFADSANLGDKITIVTNLSTSAQSAQSVSNAIGANHKGLTDALKAYEKKNNIKDVSDKEAKKQAQDWGLT